MRSILSSILSAQLCIPSAFANNGDFNELEKLPKAGLFLKYYCFITFVSSFSIPFLFVWLLCKLIIIIQIKRQNIAEILNFHSGGKLVLPSKNDQDNVQNHGLVSCVQTFVMMLKMISLLKLSNHNILMYYLSVIYHVN